MNSFLRYTAYASAILFLGAFFLTPVTTNDVWIQIKIGQLIRESWSIPNTILFAFTEAKDFKFVAHEWFSSIIVSYVYDLTKYNGLVFLKFILSSILFYLTYILCKRESQNIFLSLLISCFALVTVNYRSFMRPELFSYIFFMLELNLIHLFSIQLF